MDYPKIQIDTVADLFKLSNLTAIYKLDETGDRDELSRIAQQINSLSDVEFDEYLSEHDIDPKALKVLALIAGISNDDEIINLLC